MRTRGFTLIELMIVIAIIATIAAIAIPNLIESRRAANEASAIQMLRAITAAQTLFHDRDMDKNGVEQYSNSWGDLSQAGPIHIEQSPVRPTEGYSSGYEFALMGAKDGATLRETWMAIAVPASPGKTGDRYYYADETGVIRFATTGLVDASGYGPTNTPPSDFFLTWRPIGD